MKGERIVAGIACSQVLAQLSDYLDGDLAQAERARLESHVLQCEHCARFGGIFTDLIRSLRTQRTTPSPTPSPRVRQLLDHLEDPPPSPN